jgi:hypothetical protein
MVGRQLSYITNASRRGQRKRRGGNAKIGLPMRRPGDAASPDWEFAAGGAMLRAAKGERG